MGELNRKTKANHDNKYNEEPVYYCSRCLSLAIMESEGTLYCDKCGNTDIPLTNIYDWERMYGTKYSGNYLNR